ncbi:MAG: hypothetical protein ACLVEX_13680 [Ruthenibacterium lactatiformans]
MVPADAAACHGKPDRSVQSSRASRCPITERWPRAARGTLTRTGLHTFVDPRMGGGRVNSRTGRPGPPGRAEGENNSVRLPPVALLIRGSPTCTDRRDGNISVCDEAANGELLAMAQAAKDNGGIVICQG